MECSTCKHTVEIDDMLCYNCYLNEELVLDLIALTSEYQDEDELPF